MGSVVQELKVSLANTESALDQFFRKPEDRQIIAVVPGLLAQMRGVLSVLGLDEAGHAVANARSTVEDWLLASTPPPEAQCQRLAQNVGALSFMIDLLAYQPTAARALFTFDQSTGEFKSQVKRQSRHEPESVAPATMTDQVNLVAAQLAVGADSATEQAQLTAQLESIKLEAAIADAPEVRSVAQDALTALSTGDHQAAAEALQSLAAATPVAEAPSQPAVAAPLSATDDDGDDELRAIFLEEGKEVSTSGLQQVAQLRQSATDPEALVTLRRAFHTLKGSSRMVGLTEFGEAAWQMEQVLNGFLAEQKPASAPLLDLSQDTLEHFSKWLHAIEQGAPQPAWVEPISASAETFKATGRYLPVASGAAAAPAIDLPKDALVEAGLETDLNFDLLPAQSQPPAAQVAETALNFSLDIDAMPAIEPLAEVAPPASTAEPVAPALEASEVSMEMFLAAGGDAKVTAAPPAEPPMAEVIVHPAAEPVLPAEEGVRQIGELAIPFPLYNIYLNESDELVRRLAAELDMWRIEGKSHVPDGAIAAAHTLGGSSATVGFRPLADLGYEMEAALIACRDHQHTPGADEHAALSAGAEETRRLLHHFAAGFHKDSDPQVRAAISALRAHWQEPPRPTVNLTPALPAQNDDEIVPLAAAGLAAAAAAVAPVVTLAADVPTPGIETAPVVAAAPVEPLVPQEPAAPAFTLSAPSAPAAAVAALHDEGEVDVVDPDLFPIFEEEAQELLPNLSEALRSWVQGPADTAHPKRALRMLHTFKGSARLAGAMRLGEMAHSLESDVETVLRTEVTTATVMPLVEQCDDIVTRFEQLKRGEVHSPHEFEYHTESTPAEAAPADAVVPEVDTASPVQVDGAVAPSASAFKLAAPLANAAPTVSKANQAVRVRAGLLDRLFNQAGEVSITRARLETELGSLKGSLGDLTENLARLRQQLRDIEVQAETQMQSRMESTKETIDFDPLEFDRFTRFQELTRMMAESVNDVATVQGALNRTLQVTEDDLQRQARMTKELQRDLLRTRMVEFESLSERLYRVVRQAAKELSKNVRLDIEGGQTEMDRSVLDRLGGSFEHLLRNCVAHGIELPEQRAKAGKPEVGQISIALRQEGNEVTVVFSDDGAGLNFSRIRAKAESLGMLQPGEATTDEHMAEMIFTPGFSTADQVSEISGRGIGMDVVKSEILGLGGRVTVATNPGKGTTFTLVLPLTTAVTQIVLVRMGQLTVGVPSSLVEIVQRLKPEEIEQRYRLGRHQYSNLEVDFFPLAKLLQASLGTIGEGRTNPVLVVRSAAQRVAVHVDEILGNQEVVVRNLGPQLSRVPGLAGMSVLASGAVVLIYNPVALASVYGPSLRAAQEAAAVAAAEGAVAAGADGAGAAAVVADTPLRREPTVMITDDSLTVRRVAQRLMQRNGYRVLLAKDGLDALEVLQTETPDVMLLDIEMPRMDGFDLMRNLRSAGAEKKLRELPVIMITSRIADKHRQLATELGVNHYLGKPYNEEELLSLVSRYTKVQVPEQA
jgi:chemosensory pili system protein ChpA (sensor histidine kinase/response regulator)